MKQCINCDKNIAENSKFCEYCGAKQVTKNITDKNPSSEKSKGITQGESVQVSETDANLTAQKKESNVMEAPKFDEKNEKVSKDLDKAEEKKGKKENKQKKSKKGKRKHPIIKSVLIFLLLIALFVGGIATYTIVDKRDYAIVSDNEYGTLVELNKNNEKWLSIHKDEGYMMLDYPLDILNYELNEKREENFIIQEDITQQINAELPTWISCDKLFFSKESAKIFAEFNIRDLYKFDLSLDYDLVTVENNLMVAIEKVNIGRHIPVPSLIYNQILPETSMSINKQLDESSSEFTWIFENLDSILESYDLSVKEGNLKIKMFADFNRFISTDYEVQETTDTSATVKVSKDIDKVTLSYPMMSLEKELNGLIIRNENDKILGIYRYEYQDLIADIVFDIDFEYNNASILINYSDFRLGDDIALKGFDASEIELFPEEVSIKELSNGNFAKLPAFAQVSKVDFKDNSIDLVLELDHKELLNQLNYDYEYEKNVPYLLGLKKKTDSFSQEILSLGQSYYNRDLTFNSLKRLSNLVDVYGRDRVYKALFAFVKESTYNSLQADFEIFGLPSFEYHEINDYLKDISVSIFSDCFDQGILKTGVDLSESLTSLEDRFGSYDDSDDYSGYDYYNFDDNQNKYFMFDDYRKNRIAVIVDTSPEYNYFSKGDSYNDVIDLLSLHEHEYYEGYDYSSTVDYVEVNENDYIINLVFNDDSLTMISVGSKSLY